MEIRIFNVGHGACALILGDPDAGRTSNVALVDCGSEPRGFRPSNYVLARGFSGIEHLIVSHYDEDHVADLPNLLALGTRVPIVNVHHNGTLNPNQIVRMKRQGGPIEPGVRAIIGMLGSATPNPSEQALAALPLRGFEVEMYENAYPLFVEPNNLSVVTFLHHRDVSIVFPGDLETAGWRALLADRRFRESLGRVNVFVTSHHGRSNGYCAEVFDHCWPDVFVTSDTNRQYGTQEQRYDQHAAGILWNGGPERRCCLTTRRDGHIRIISQAGGGYFIETSVAV